MVAGVDWVSIADEFSVIEEPYVRPTRLERALASKPDPLLAGHRIFDAIRRDLDRLDTLYKRRTYNQKRGQDLFLSCFCRLVYGECFAQNQIAIMKYNNW